MAGPCHPANGGQQRVLSPEDAGLATSAKVVTPEPVEVVPGRWAQLAGVGNDVVVVTGPRWDLVHRSSRQCGPWWRRNRTNVAGFPTAVFPPSSLTIAPQVQTHRDVCDVRRVHLAQGNRHLGQSRSGTSCGSSPATAAAPAMLAKRLPRCALYPGCARPWPDFRCLPPILARRTDCITPPTPAFNALLTAVPLPEHHRYQRRYEVRSACREVLRQTSLSFTTGQINVVTATPPCPLTCRASPAIMYAGNVGTAVGLGQRGASTGPAATDGVPFHRHWRRR